MVTYVELSNEFPRGEGVAQAAEPCGGTDGHDTRRTALGLDAAGDGLHPLGPVLTPLHRDDLGAEEPMQESVARGHVGLRSLGDEDAPQAEAGGGGGRDPAVIGLRAAGGDEVGNAFQAVGRELELELSDLVASQGKAGLGIHLQEEVLHAEVGSEARGPPQGGGQCGEWKTRPPEEEFQR